MKDDANKTDMLPWKRNANLSGYRALDMLLVIGEPVGEFSVTRIDRDQPGGGNFVAKHNGVRISDRDYADRADAQAECERYIYDLPIFEKSKPRVEIVMRLNMGRDAFHAGQSVLACPFKPDRPQERSQWVEGWLQAYVALPVAKAINSASATIKAFGQLEHDMAMLSGRLTVWKTAVAFALERGKDDDDTDQALRFLELFNGDDPDATHKEFPDWIPFFEKTTGATVTRVDEASEPT